MAHSLGEVEREILMSGVDDWVDIPEGMHFAYQLIGHNASETEALAVVIAAVKNLLRLGLIEIGEVTNGFSPWIGSLNELEKRIDHAQKQARFPIRFGNLFWIRNTSTGDRKGEQLLEQENTTEKDP